MLPERGLVGREIHAINLIVGHVAVDPLDRAAHLVQDLQRLQRKVPDLGFRQLPRSGNLALYHELRHGFRPRS